MCFHIIDVPFFTRPLSDKILAINDNDCLAILKVLTRFITSLKTEYADYELIYGGQQPNIHI